MQADFKIVEPDLARVIFMLTVRTKQRTKTAGQAVRSLSIKLTRWKWQRCFSNRTVQFIALVTLDSRKALDTFETSPWNEGDDENGFHREKQSELLFYNILLSLYSREIYVKLRTYI